MSGLHCNQSVGLPSSSDVGYSQAFIQRGYRDVTCEHGLHWKMQALRHEFSFLFVFLEHNIPLHPITILRAPFGAYGLIASFG